MPSAYEELVKTGYIGSLKRDILLEAAVDLEYVGHIHRRFTDSSAAAARDAIECTVELINDLTANGLCELATWSNGYGTEPEALGGTPASVTAIVKESTERDNVFKYFLVATDAGRAWVRRYDALVAEL